MRRCFECGAVLEDDGEVYGEPIRWNDMDFCDLECKKRFYGDVEREEE